MKNSIKWFLIATMYMLLPACAEYGVSFEKPIRVILSQAEIDEYEADLRNGNFKENDFDRVYVFEGVLISSNENSGEVIHQFKILNRLSMRDIPEELTEKNMIDIISPSFTNGGVTLSMGKKYRVAAPLLPDSRLAIWKGVIVTMDTK